MKPILFNTEMVQAILEGRKTTTRRLFKDLKEFESREDGFIQADISNKNGVYYFAGTIEELSKLFSKYKVGDILYVRETWCIQSMKNYEKNIKFLYKARSQELNEVSVSDERYKDLIKFISKNGWQPSLFMPKEAARIFLKVTNVKVERLKDITDEGARLEGANHMQKYYFPFRVKHDEKHKKCLYEKPLEYGDYRTTFAQIWDNTLNKNDKLAWKYTFENNPYVWVIEFERISKDEALKESN